MWPSIPKGQRRYSHACSSHLFQKWKRLSRLQRSLLLFILLFIFGIASYPTINHHLNGEVSFDSLVMLPVFFLCSPSLRQAGSGCPVFCSPSHHWWLHPSPGSGLYLCRGWRVSNLAQICHVKTSPLLRWCSGNMHQYHTTKRGIF